MVKTKSIQDIIKEAKIEFSGVQEHSLREDGRTDKILTAYVGDHIDFDTLDSLHQNLEALEADILRASDRNGIEVKFTLEKGVYEDEEA